MRSPPPFPAGFTQLEDYLLADVAVRIQLSPTDYAKAVARYETINNHIDRPSSPLSGLVELFYPQGSMAIGSTIASRLTTDEFDVDTVAQLLLPPNTQPQVALDLLYEAIRGEPGSRYYDVARRQTRCVTIDYADRMHVDVTPMVRLSQMPERESVIFHHRPEERSNPGYRKIANPYGFGIWVIKNIPRQPWIEEAYAVLAKSRGIALRADAEQDPVPDQDSPYRKPLSIVALQLLKRNRNVRYDARDVRRPPSVLLSRSVTDNAGHAVRLSDELLHQARQLLHKLSDCQKQRTLIRVCNPVCEEDVLTDRWPETFDDQALYIKDLSHFVEQIQRIQSGCPLDEMQDILADLFGERPTLEVVKSFADELGAPIRQGESYYAPGIIKSAGSMLGASAAAAAGTARATPKHTFFGD